MPIITFWSHTKKQTGQTMSLVAMATSMAIEHNYRILILSTQYNDNTLELCFGTMENNKTLLAKILQNPTTTVDNGIEGLSKIVTSNRMTPDSIQNYTHVIYKNRLEVLYGYKEVEGRSTKEEYLKVKNKYKEIIQNAGKFYDMVFVDLDRGLEDDMVKQVLQVSDVIVTNVEQRIDMIEDISELRRSQEFFGRDNVILNIGRFDDFSKYSVKNVSRYIGIKRDILTIPYNTLYFEAASEQKVADLFLRIRKVSGTDRNAVFVNTVKDAAEKIIYKCQELQMKI